MDNENIVPIPNGIHNTATRKPWNNEIFSKWVVLEKIILSELAYTQKDKCCLFSWIYGS